MIATREVLEPLGFKLKDCGAYWQANAAHRGGDNPTSIQIYKDTGVWRDFARDSKMLPFKLLLKEFGVTVKSAQVVVEDREEYMKVEKTYDQSILSRLLPHYSFYNNRGITDDVLKKYRGGLATQGKMYQRFTFPVFNKDGRIHGFNGRDLLNKDTRPKWKKIGKSQSFLYPFYMLDKYGDRTFDDGVVDFSKDVFLVESIGDSMNLTQHAMSNHFVTFGKNLSNTISSKLISLNPNRIIVCLNNDSGKEVNAGLEGSLKAAHSLSHFFNKDKIHLVLPTKNDFGDMRNGDFNLWHRNLEKSNGWSDIVKLARTAEKENTVSRKVTCQIL